MYLLWSKPRGRRSDASVSWRNVQRAKSIFTLYDACGCGPRKTVRLHTDTAAGDDLKYITKAGVQIWRNW